MAALGEAGLFVTHGMDLDSAPATCLKKNKNPRGLLCPSHQDNLVDGEHMDEVGFSIESPTGEKKILHWNSDPTGRCHGPSPGKFCSALPVSFSAILPPIPDNSS